MALAYARQRIPVLACQGNGKRPAPCCPNGFKDRTTNEAIINRWFAEADYNLAIVPEDAGWCVVDVDNKLLADGSVGLDAWAALIAEHPVPATRTGASAS